MVIDRRNPRGVTEAGPRLALALCVLAACVHPDYECSSDSDCDVGTAGRCELDHRCTAVDPNCATNRRYSDHSGPKSGTCFDDRVAPLDLCAAGQPPATPESCAASVCDVLPTCCSTGWSEACVQQAQIRCSDVVCDTRIAITANKPGGTPINQLWDLRWNGATWSARLDTQHDARNVLAWLAPGPGEREPHLAGFVTGVFVVDNVQIPVAGTHNYFEATSVDFDRDGRATAALAYTDGRGTHFELTKLDDSTAREVSTAAATRLSWGDVDHDAFPDGIAETGAGAGYRLLSNIDGAGHLREIDDRVTSNVSGGPPMTGTPPAVRSFDWIDLDGDQLLDVIAYGYSVDIHLARGEPIGPGVLLRIDCDPPAAASSCDTATLMEQTFAGAALPTQGTPALIIASQPVRALYRIELGGTMVSRTQYRFPASACGTTCPPIIAVVVRDLDGDHALDVVAIDADLQVFTGLARDNLQLRAAIKLPTVPAAPGFIAVRTSVTGAPR